MEIYENLSEEEIDELVERYVNEHLEETRDWIAYHDVLLHDVESYCECPIENALADDIVGYMVMTDYAKVDLLRYLTL